VFQPETLLSALISAEAAFVIVGGVAAVAQGSSYVTADLDVCYDRDPSNLERLSQALRPFNPRLRGAPPDLPCVLDARTLRGGLNFTLSTDAGDIDLLGEVAGLGSYTDVLAHADFLELYGHEIAVLSLEGLIRSKEAAGRPKDLLVLPELRALEAHRALEEC
jgi:hypothetical protein